MTDDPLRPFKGIWLAMWLGVIMWVAIGVLCSGCATDNSWMGTAKDFRHAPAVTQADPATWRPYHNYKQDKCELCLTAKDLEWSHEKPQSTYPELRNDPNNGHTLCRKCHVFFHFQNTSKYWCENMDEIIEVLQANRRTYK